MTSSQQTWEIEKGQREARRGDTQGRRPDFRNESTQLRRNPHGENRQHSGQRASTAPERWAGACGLRCGACIWTNVISSYRYQETRGTESNCMRVQLGQTVDKRYKETKNPAATSKVSGAKAGSCSHPLHTTPRSGWADHPGHLSGLTLGPATALTHLRNQLTRLLGERAGHPSLVPPSTAARAPVKPRLNFSPDLSSVPTDGDGPAPGWSPKEQVGRRGQ